MIDSSSLAQSFVVYGSNILNYSIRWTRIKGGIKLPGESAAIIYHGLRREKGESAPYERLHLSMHGMNFRR